MAVTMHDLKNREFWLNQRYRSIGGSDAATIMGVNPYMNNVELWEIRTHRRKREDISDVPYVRYGIEAEDHLRELFKLDYPQYQVEYVENNLWVNDKYPYAHASLDGWMTDEDGRRGVLEIKTVNVVNPAVKQKWDDRIPDNYYCQVLWYMGVYEADFAVIKAQLKWERGDSVLEVTKHYHIEREEVEDEIEYLMQKGAEVHEYIKSDTCPPLNLPEI